VTLTFNLETSALIAICVGNFPTNFSVSGSFILDLYMSYASSDLATLTYDLGGNMSVHMIRYCDTQYSAEQFW